MLGGRCVGERVPVNFNRYSSSSGGGGVPTSPPPSLHHFPPHHSTPLLSHLPSSARQTVTLLPPRGVKCRPRRSWGCCCEMRTWRCTNARRWNEQRFWAAIDFWRELRVLLSEDSSVATAEAFSSTGSGCDVCLPESSKLLYNTEWREENGKSLKVYGGN